MLKVSNKAVQINEEQQAYDDIIKALNEAK